MAEIDEKRHGRDCLLLGLGCKRTGLLPSVPAGLLQARLASHGVGPETRDGLIERDGRRLRGGDNPLAATWAGRG